MSRILARCTAVALVACAGCAGSRSGATPSMTPTVNLAPITQQVMRSDGSIVDVNAAPLNSGVTTRLASPIEPAWAALKATYGELGIPVTTQVEASHLVENPSFTARRRVGAVPMQKIVDCGNKQGIPNAESFEVRMAISSYLVENPAGGRDLVTRIQASGVSPYFSGSARVNCPSFGELERVIGQMVRSKWGRP